MATEDEAREAADGEEVQVEAVDLGTTHLQMNLDRKLASHEEIKGEAKIMDSTEGLLKVTDDQVLEKAPSSVEVPAEDTPNGTASSLDGHMEEEISDEKPQENGQKDDEQVEASSDGVSTDQSNKSNGEEAIDSLGHVEGTTQDTSLLIHENEEPKEHYQQDVEGGTVEDEMVHEDTLQTDEPAIDAQQGQNLEPAEVTEDTKHASTSCISHDEVAAEAPAGVQTPIEANVDDSGALPDASDGNTETEPAKVDKESCPEDEEVAEQTNEIIKPEDQPSKQIDDVDADLVQEEVPKKTDVPEDTIKTEQADESTNDDQDELNQESPEDTSDPVYAKAEETSHESNVFASEETAPEYDAITRETALDVQEVQSQGLAEEIADAKEVDTEEAVQQSGVASEEATPEYNVATIEPSSDIQHLSDVESEEIKVLEDTKAEETSNQSNVIIAEDAAQDKESTEDIQPVQGLEEEPKSTGTVELDEVSSQPQADVLDNLAEEDDAPACQPEVIELEEEAKDNGVAETQEITQQSHVAASEELVTEDNSKAVESQNDDIQQTLEQESVELKDTETSETQEICHERTISASEKDSAEDDVTAEGPTSVAQEVENRGSVEEIKNNTDDNIVEASDMATVEEADQENNMLSSEDVHEQQTRELEPEEVQSTESVEPQGISPSHIISTSEESTPEDKMTAEPRPDSQAENLESAVTEETKDVKSTDAVAEEETPEEHVQEFKAPVHTPVAKEPELEETKNTDNQINAAVLENPTHEDNQIEVSSSEATEGQEMPQSEVTQSEDYSTEENTIASEPKILEPELAEEMRDTEATEPQSISEDSIVSSSEESVPEEDVTAKEIASDIKEVQTEEPELIEEHNDAKAGEISNQSSGTIVGEIAQENLESATVTEETRDVKSTDAIAEEHVQEFEAPVDTPPVEEPDLEETKNTEPAEVHDNVATNDLPAEEVNYTEATETAEIQNESGDLTEDVKSNVALADEAAPEEDAKATEATADKPHAQDPELEEIKNSEPVKVEDNIIASDLPEEEIKDTEAMETEVIPDESTSAKITELTNDVKNNVALAEEAAPEEYVTETEATIHIPGAQEPELEDIKNTEPVEVKESISASDLPAEEVKETEATETEVLSESTDANISEPTEDAETNVALADEAAPEENVIATEATVDIPRAQEPELEEIENAEHVEVEENISANDLPAEENFTENEPQMTDIEPTRPEPTPNESNVACLEEMATEDNTTTLTDVTIQQRQEQEPVEFRDTEATSEEPAPEDNVTTEVSPDTQAENLESAAVTEETKDVKSTDTIAEEETPEEHVHEFESPVDIPPVEQPELEETKNTEPVEVHDNVMTNDLPAEEVKDTQATEIAEIHNDVKTNVALTDEAAPDEDAKATETTADIPQAEEPELEEIKNSEPVEVEDNIISREMAEEEIKDTEAMETEMIPDESTGANIGEITDDVKSNVALADEAAPEEHVIATEATIDVPRAQEPEQEEIKNTEPVEVEENISATDQSAEETEATEAMESEAINESIDANNSDATEREEASHPSQDPGLEKLVSESNAATLEPTADIQQVSDLDVVEEMTAAEAINDEEISCKKTEVATLEDQSPTELDEETLVNEINNAEPTERKEQSSDLGEKAAFTTPEGESPTEEDAQTSGEDTVGVSNNIEQIKEQSKAEIEHDTIQSADHTNVQDEEQLHNAELQMEVCERSLDVSAIEQPDEDVQKDKDQQQNEDEAIEKQTEEIQRDEQKHDDRTADLTTETLLEPQSSEIGTANLHEDTDVFEPEQALHTPQGSIPSIADVKVEDSTEIEETPEQENTTNNTDTLYADAEKYNECEKENIEIDAAVAKLSIDEQDGPTDETINEEVGNGMASPIEKDLQKSSDPASSNEEMLENDTTVVHENVEPRVHREERECINKANDDMQAIQASEEEIVDEVEKKQEMQNEDTDVNNDEVQTKPIDEEASEQHSNDSTYSKMDDTMSPYAEMEEVEDNKGFSNTSENVIEKSEQNDVAQDLSIHPKVVEVETNSNEEMATSYTEVTEAVKSDEVIDNKACGADGALSDENLETTEDSRRNLEASSVATASGESMDEDKEHHNLALPAYSAVDEKTTEQASASEVTERELLFPEKPLPTESEEHQESQTTKEQDEEDIHEHETGDTEKEEKEDEQSELPVSNFLMNLIMGKENTEPDEAEKKQEETTKDDSCLITSQLEENLVPIPTENKVDNKLIFEQGKHNLEGSEETHDSKLESDDVLSTNTHNLEAPVGENNVQGEVSSELVPGGSGLMTELETRDVKLGEKATNSEKGSLNSNLDDSTNPRVSLEDTLEEVRTDLQHESLPEDIRTDAVAGQTLLSRELNTSDEKKLPKDNDDLQSPLGTKREEATESSITEAESTIEAERETEVEKEEEKHHTTNRGGGPEGQVENLHDNSQKGAQAISDEQTAEITEPVMGTEINLVHEKEISAGSECEEETQSSKLSNSELHNSEKALDIQSDDSSLHINQDKQDEFAGHQIVMEKNNLLDKPEESNLHEEQETEIAQESPIKSDGVDKNCLAITESVIKEENANRTVESHVQTVNTKSSEEQEIFMSQVQERGLEVVSAKEAPEAEEDIVQMAKPEFSTDEEQSSKEDKSNMAGEKTCVEKTKDEAEAKSFTDEVTTKIEEQGEVQKATHNQTRDFNVVLPTEAPGSEESFVDVKTPEFSTDEEQSPKKDESNMAEEKSYDEKTNSTDEAPMKTEEREAGQKASPKKHNILSGVGSKVKHQLAKVKKAIIGKPGHTKSESPKS